MHRDMKDVVSSKRSGSANRYASILAQVNRQEEEALKEFDILSLNAF